MRKLCFRDSISSGAQLASGSFRSGGALHRFHRLGGGGGGGLLSRPAAKMLPPTQSVSGARYGQLALRARLNPALSLFNRLGEFVAELEQSREFFKRWPERLCQQIRAEAARGSPAASVAARAPARNASIPLEQQTACWNGRDFNGYSKKVEPFGQAPSASHPEVPMVKAVPVNTIILDFVARLREVGGQLSRIAKRSSSHFYQQALDISSLVSMVAKSSGAESASTPTSRILEAEGELGAIRADARVAGDESATSPLVIISEAISRSHDLDLEDAAATSSGEHPAPISGAEQSRGYEADEAAETEPAEEEDEEEEDEEKSNLGKNCKELDCIDLFSENVEGAPDNRLPGAELAHEHPGAIKIPVQLDPERPLTTVVVLQPRPNPNPNHRLPLFPADDALDSGLHTTLYPMSPPPQSASSSLLDIYNFGSLLLILILVFAILTARKAFKREQIIVV